MLTKDSLKIAPVFRRNIRPSKGTPNLLLQLPPEIRNCIYELVLVSDRSPHRGSLSNHPPLLRTCKQFRHEALPVLCGNQVFNLNTSLDGRYFKWLTGRLYGIVDICGRRPFKSTRIELKGAIWTKLHEMIQMLGECPTCHILPRHNTPSSCRRR